MSDVHELTAAQQVAELRARRLSSRELTQHYLDRVDRLGDALGAFATVGPDHALREADVADTRLAAGDPAPLLGLPLGFKDLHPVAGVRTTLGSAALPEVVPAADGWAVGLLRSAGSVLLGTTHAAELGATCFTESPLVGRPAVTPYDTARCSSGSSGGAATAVAAGLLPVAHASDGAGSIRTPAATCHLVGVKPSRGLVSSAAATSFFSPGTEGVIARTVQDAALLLDVMAEPWPGDLHGWRPAGPLVDSLVREPGPLRVAVWTATGIDGHEPDPEAVAAVERTARLLEELGHAVVPLPVPAPIGDAVHRALLTGFACSVDATVAALVPDERRERLTPYSLFLLEVASRLTARDVVQAQAVLAGYAGSFLEALSSFDAALTPTASGPPVPVAAFQADDPVGLSGRMLAWSCYTPWANLTGQPAISLPAHLDARGLPRGVQLVGRPRGDAALLALCAQLERAQPWHDVHPPAWDQA